MYPHRVDIERMTGNTTKIVAGVEISVPSSGVYEVEHEKVSCRWSYSNKRVNTVNSDGGEQLIVIEYKVFFRKSVDIRKGDVMSYNGNDYLVYNVVPIFNYSSLHHLEVEVVSYER